MGRIENQLVFDKLMNYMRTLDSPVTRVWHGHIIPAYKGDDNRLGPIGYLLSPIYHPDFENTTPMEKGMVRFILENRNIDHKLCSQIQRVHDEEEVTKWEECFEGLAARWRLIYDNPIKDTKYTAFQTYIKIILPVTSGDEVAEKIECQCESIFEALHKTFAKHFPQAEINIGGHTLCQHHDEKELPV